MGVTLVGAQQVGDHGGDVRTGLVGVLVDVELVGDVADQVLAVRLRGRELGVDASERGLQIGNQLLRPLQWRAFRQQNARLDDVALQVRKGGELQEPAGRGRDGEQHGTDGKAER